MKPQISDKRTLLFHIGACEMYSHVCVGMCTCECKCTYKHACGGQRLTSRSFHNHFPLYFLRQCLIEPAAHLYPSKIPGICLSVLCIAKGLQAHADTPSVYVGAGDLNLGPHVCVMSTLSNTISPATQFFFLLTVYCFLCNSGDRTSGLTCLTGTYLTASFPSCFLIFARHTLIIYKLLYNFYFQLVEDLISKRL